MADIKCTETSGSLLGENARTRGRRYEDSYHASRRNAHADANMRIGRLGEAMASEILRKKGYYIICNNFKCPYGEVDIIASKGDRLVFIEVKTRTSDDFGRPAEAVNYRKRQHIKNSARYFLSSSRKKYKYVDFNVIEIWIRHICDLDF